MSDREVLFIFHYGSDFKFDISRPVYNGGKQKMRYLLTDITFESLVKEAIEASNGESSFIQNISINTYITTGEHSPWPALMMILMLGVCSKHRVMSLMGYIYTSSTVRLTDKV